LTGAIRSKHGGRRLVASTVHARSILLFEGFKIKFTSGKIKLFQQ
jgi:hypothetical protein